MVVARRAEAAALAAGVFIALVAALLVFVVTGQAAAGVARLPAYDSANAA